MTSGSDPAMPPTNAKLSPTELHTLRSWIVEGANDDAPTGQTEAEQTWWSLRPLRQPPVPDVDRTWVRNPIDRFVLAALQGKGLFPSADADKRTLIRRLSYDLRGLPPSTAAIDAFTQDSRPNAYEALVDQMLASPAHGERWGRHWLDVARFGESNGYEQNHLRNSAWPYRDWVIDAFNADMPFNRMMLEQLAGDQVAPGNPQVEAATGFLVAGPHDTVKIRNLEGEAQKRANHLDDMIMATSSAFLGLTVHCARCHDHKFDPIRTVDYYRMQAAFAGVWHGERHWDSTQRIAESRAIREPLEKEIAAQTKQLDALKSGAAQRVERRRAEILEAHRPPVDPTGTEESFETVQAKYVRLTVERATAGRTRVDLAELSVWTADPNARNVALGARATASGTRVDAARSRTYAPDNLVDGKFNRRWISEGKLPVWVQVALPRPETIARVTWSTDRLGGFGGRFGPPMPEQYRVEVSTDGELWQEVASSEGRLPYTEAEQDQLVLDTVLEPSERKEWSETQTRLKRAEANLRRAPRPRQAFLGQFEEPDEPSFVMVRGDPMNRGEVVSTASLSTLDGLLGAFALESDAPEGERRLALARWLASDRNALAARVIVNRVWMHHFGSPLARNPSDLGINGGEPTHPHLLEWLAHRLVHRHGWRLKPLHRDILLSSAYRQSSAYRADAASVDRDGAYLWRFPPRRLTAEELRDSILFASGNLDRTMGGPGFQLYLYTVDNVATYYPLKEFGRETMRRAVYHQHARSVKPELLGEFDCPDTSLPAPTRIATTSPLQALSLLNNEFTLNEARAFSRRVATLADDGSEHRVTVAWRLAFGREPLPQEVERSADLIKQHGLESLARALFNANEFLYVF